MIFRSAVRGPWKSLRAVDRVKGVETRGVNVGETEEGLRERRGADARGSTQHRLVDEIPPTEEHKTTCAS